MSYLLKTEGLSKTYTEFSLEDINISVESGEVVGLVGSNGAGKTTAIKSILGLVYPNAGQISLFGEPVFGFQGVTPNGFCETALMRAKANMGVVFDSCPFYSEMTISNVARMGAHAYETWNNSTFNNLCNRFGIKQSKSIKSLSRGMGMKLQLAFSLAHSPSLLILDEATAGLDPIAREEVLDLLRTFMTDETNGTSSNRGILMSTHITSDLEKMADRVICIDAGKCLFSANVEDICDTAGIAQCGRADKEALINYLRETANEQARIIQNSYSLEVLVPNRTEVTKRFPELAIERANIESYMQFMLKGETI